MQLITTGVDQQMLIKSGNPFLNSTLHYFQQQISMPCNAIYPLKNIMILLQLTCKSCNQDEFNNLPSFCLLYIQTLSVRETSGNFLSLKSIVYIALPQK